MLFGGCGGVEGCSAPCKRMHISGLERTDTEGPIQDKVSHQSMLHLKMSLEWLLGSERAESERASCWILGTGGAPGPGACLDELERRIRTSQPD
jgi:hypothetical protein